MGAVLPPPLEALTAADPAQVIPEATLDAPASGRPSYKSFRYEPDNAT